MRFLIIFLFIFISLKSYAEGASQTTRYLMNEPFSLFEWGMLKLEEEIINYVKEENQKARKCEDYFFKIENKKKELANLLSKEYEDLVGDEKWDIDFFNNDEESYNNSCKHFKENGKIVGHYIDYDFENDLINIIFGQNYNLDTELKNFKKYYKDESFYLSNEKCKYNRQRITGRIFYIHPLFFERMSKLSDEEFYKREDTNYSKPINIFRHKYWKNNSEPKDLAAHLYKIIKVGVIVGEGFEEQKSIICWESIRILNPSYKIGLQAKIIDKFFNTDSMGIFVHYKNEIFFKEYN